MGEVGKVKHEMFELSESDFSHLNSNFPPGRGSGLIGARSTEIVKIYFKSKNTNCKFRDPRNGADLEVILKGQEPFFLEIKGTEDANIAWQKIKVSSEQSYRMLVEEGTPIYRVTNVFLQYWGQINISTWT